MTFPAIVPFESGTCMDIVFLCINIERNNVSLLSDTLGFRRIRTSFFHICFCFHLNGNLGNSPNAPNAQGLANEG